LAELQLQTADFNMLLARLARKRRVDDKRVQIEAEKMSRILQMGVDAYANMSDQRRQAVDQEIEAEKRHFWTVQQQEAAGLR
jgi:hypothetical protein